MPITLDGTNGITTPTYGGADTSEYLVPVTQFKNRIINGDMRIDQRNAGASIVPTSGGNYPVDRFIVRQNTDGSATAQRSTDAPSGFINSVLYTVTGTDTSLAATQFVDIAHRIEGLNIYDFGWGTASAKTISVSFWVKSSVTGTYVVSPQNNAFNRSYPATYTINSANTWEYKTITIPGDTSGTWLTDTGVGMYLSFTLASGTTYQGTANTWNSAGTLSVSSAVNLMATNGATFYLTGVQLEVGSTATSFDYRPYTTELQLCQRYFQVFQSQTGVEYAFFGVAIGGYGTTYMRLGIPAQVQMRATPSLGSSAVGTFYLEGGYTNSVSAITGYGTTSRNLFVWQITTPTTATGPSWLYALNTTSAFLTASAEL